MTDVPFHLTRSGRTYYEHSVPELDRQFTRVGDALERLIELNEPTLNAAPDAAAKLRS